MDRAAAQPKLLRLICAGLAGALSAFVIPVSPAPAKPVPPAGKAESTAQSADPT